ncbi:hypothetical protein ACPB8Q_05080 [Methanocaldococcus indicus]|uniref:hypothetical protein n=1 Tax=Methanocaldococcus indicus TaxID=213231 RepID=UPI003C6CDDE8
MAVGYAKLYELILKKVKDEKEAREIYDIIIELNKENKIIIKNELKDELRSELATKEDILILEEKMNSIKEEILRYVDSKFHQLDKKFTIFFIIILFTIIITNPNAIELIKLLFGVK